jgi:hypothetical protein
MNPTQALVAAIQASTVDMLRTLGLLGFVSVTVLAVWLWSFGGRGGDLKDVAAALALVQAWRDRIGWFSPAWSGASVAVLGAVALWLAWRAGKTRVSDALTALHKREFERLRDLGERGELPPLLPNEDMQKVMSRLSELGQIEEAVAAKVREGELPEYRGREIIDEVQADTNRLHLLLAFLDLNRRIDVEVAPEVAIPEHRGAWSRARTFLASEGFLRGLNRGSRALLYMSLLLLIPSLVGVHAAALDQGLARERVRLDELQVRLAASEARREWEEASKSRGESNTPSDPSGQDRELIEELSASFEDALTERLQSEASEAPQRSSGHVAGSVRNVLIRQAILTEYATGRGNLSARSIDVDADTNRVLQLASDEHVGTRSSSLRTRIQTDLASIAEAHPGLWSEVRAAMRTEAASFRQPASVRQVSQMILGHALGAALSGAPADGVVGEVAQKLTHAVTPERLQEIYRQQLQTFVARAAREGGIERGALSLLDQGPRRPVWTEIETERLNGALADLPTHERYEQLLDDLPPTLDVVPAHGEDLPAARRETQQMLRGVVSPADAERLSSSLAQYDDHFPGRPVASSNSDRSALLAGLSLNEEGPRLGGGSFDPGPPSSGAFGGPGGGFNGGLGGSGGTSGPHGSGPSRPQASLARSAFGRARSFFQLRGFSRVGGVLIGQAASGPDLDIRAIDWEWLSGPAPGFRLVMTDARGQRLLSEEFPASVVGAALAYAADGRPTAVTMVTAEPLLDLRILVHPALVDTPIGCRAVWLDRMVDTYARSGKSVKVAVEQVEAQGALYQLAWFAAAEAALSDPNLPLRMRWQVPALQERLRSEVLRAIASKALGSSLWDPTRSVLAGKQRLFDPALSRMTMDCGAKGNIDEFVACVRARSGSEVPEPPPETQVWSGVREHAYAVAELFEARELAPAAANEAPFRPLDFVLQVSFATHPERLNPSQGEWYDAEPWQFPAVASDIEQALQDALRKPANARDLQYVRDMQIFVRLQRVFRAGFEGKLGDRFPLDRLAALAREARRYAPAASPTPRWTARGGILERAFARWLTSVLPGLPRGLAAGARRCIALIGKSSKPQSIPEEEWARACTFSGATANGTELTEKLTKSAADAHSARKIRASLNVQAHESPPEACASL